MDSVHYEMDTDPKDPSFKGLSGQTITKKTFF